MLVWVQAGENEAGALWGRGTRFCAREGEKIEDATFLGEGLSIQTGSGPNFNSASYISPLRRHHFRPLTSRGLVIRMEVRGWARREGARPLHTPAPSSGTPAQPPPAPCHRTGRR